MTTPIPATERRKRAYQKLWRNVPIVLLCTMMAYIGLTTVGGKVPLIFAWGFVVVAGYNVVIGIGALLIQLLDIVAYFLVTDQQWSEAKEKDPLSSDLRWKTVGLIPAVLYVALWGAPGFWTYTLLER